MDIVRRKLLLVTMGLKGLRSVTASQLVPNVNRIFAIGSYFCLALSLWPVNDHINGETLHLLQTYT